MSSDSPTRREILTTSLLLSFTTSGTASVSSAEAARLAEEKILVAYFSRSGNTRVVAGQISRTLHARLFEIESAQPYPADYFETVEQARWERDNGDEPLLKAELSDIAPYTILFVGFPIWGETAPPVIRSFLAAHDLSGKTIIPFITHGGYGLGNSLSVVGRHAPQARIVEGYHWRGLLARQSCPSWLNQNSSHRIFKR